MHLKIRRSRKPIENNVTSLRGDARSLTVPSAHQRAAAKCTVATGPTARDRPDNIYVLRIQCAVSYQLIEQERREARRSGEGRGRAAGIGCWSSRDRIQVTVAIALKRTCTRVRCMYDPTILPPRAPLIYIGSDLPILCITRARIVISLWASEVQSSGMAVAGARSTARIYRFLRVPRPIRSIPRMETERQIHDPYSHRIQLA